MVALPAAVDADVFHRPRPRDPLLHRAVLVARLQQLHAGRRNAAKPAGDLEWATLPGISRGAAERQPAARLRQLRTALEFMTSGATACAAGHPNPRRGR